MTWRKLSRFSIEYPLDLDSESKGVVRYSLAWPKRATAVVRMLLACGSNMRVSDSQAQHQPVHPMH